MVSEQWGGATETVVVSGERLCPRRTLVRAGETGFVVGDDADPLEYLLGSLAGCVNVVGHLVARDMGFVVRDLSVAVEGDIDPARYRGETEEGRAGFREIRVTVTVDADADAETLERWVAAVEERCPVGENLRGRTRTTVVADPA